MVMETSIVNIDRIQVPMKGQLGLPPNKEFQSNEVVVEGKEDREEVAIAGGCR